MRVMSSENDGYARKLVQLSEGVFTQDSKMQKAYLFYCIDFMGIILTDFYVQFFLPEICKDYFSNMIY